MNTCACGARVRKPTHHNHKGGKRHQTWLQQQVQETRLALLTAAVEEKQDPAEAESPNGVESEYVPDLLPELVVALQQMDNINLGSENRRAQVVARRVRQVFDIQGWMDDSEHQTVTEFLEEHNIPILPPEWSPPMVAETA
jgi:hypothetical protein